LFVPNHIAECLAHVLLEVSLLLGELLSFAREPFHLLASLLTALTGQHLTRFAEPLSGAPGFGFALWCSLILGVARVLHVARRFRQTLDRAI
jgi:hypothetical protein